MKRLLRGRTRWLLAGGVLVALAVAVMLSRPPLQRPTAIQLVDVTAETGVAFQHTDGNSGQWYIPETMTGGLALFDYDGDGWTDIYFTNGAPLSGSRVEEPVRNALYRNEGGFRFTDVTLQSGIGDPGYGLGVAVGDYDNDGSPDVFVNNYGPNALYRNNGDGGFINVTQEAGVAGGDVLGAGAGFFDMDRDGDLDLYVANYVDFTYEAHQKRTYDGYPVYGGPLEYEPLADLLYRNNGDGTFTDVSQESGVATHCGSSTGVVCSDYDRDGDTDVFVLSDVGGNLLFANDGTGKLEEVGLAAAVAYNVDGDSLGSRGVDCGDFDNDGWLDFFATSYVGELPVLFRNLGNGSFQDVTLTAGAGAGSLPHANWGTGFVDFDSDGDRDLFLACGHVLDNVSLFDDISAYQLSNILLLNNGRGEFINVSDASGDGLLVKRSSRGAGFDDLDNDGDSDAVILNVRREPTLMRNDSALDNHWIQIQLRGVRSNRDGVGARVTVTAGDWTQAAEVHSGRGYQSHYGTRLHFGLGRQNRVDRIEVRWLGGETTTIENVAVDQRVTVTEGAATVDTSPSGGRSAS